MSNIALNKRVKGINIPIGADTSTLDKALKTTESQISKLYEEAKEIDKALKFNPESIDLLGQKSRVTSENINALSEKLKMLKDNEANVFKQFATNKIDQSQYDGYIREIIHVESSLEKLKDKQKETNKAVEDSNDVFKNFAGTMNSTGQQIISFGDILKANILSDLIMDGVRQITSELKNIGTQAITSAISFESAFAGVEKTVDGTTEQIAGLRDGILEMSKDIPQTADAIAEVAALAGQFGIETPKIEEFTKVMLGLGDATNLSSEQAAMALSQFANITKMSQDDFDRLGSTIVALGNNFSTQESTIALMSQRLASAGSQAGFTEAEILGLSTAMASLGVSEQIGGSAMSKVIGKIQLAVETASDELEQFAEIAGMSAEKFSKAFKEDAASAFQEFIKGIGDAERNGKSALAVLSDLEIKETGTMRTLSSLAGNSELLAKSLDVANRAWEENTALQKEVSTRYATTESRLAMMQDRLTAVGISVGEKVLPAIVELSEAFVGFVEKNQQGIADFVTRIVDFVEVIIDGAPVIIPLVTGIGTALATWKIGTALGPITDQIINLSGSLLTATPGVVGFGAALNTALGPIGWIALGLAAVTTAATALSGAWSRYKQEQEEARQAMIHAGDELQELRAELEQTENKMDVTQDQIKKWQELSESIENNAGSAEELSKAKSDLKDVQNQLIESSDGIITNLDIENGKVSERLELLNLEIQAERDLAEARLRARVEELEEQDVIGQLEDAIEKRNKLIDTEQKQIDLRILLKQHYQDYLDLLEKEKSTGEDQSEKIKQLKDNVDLLTESYGIGSMTMEVFREQGRKGFEILSDGAERSKESTAVLDEEIEGLTKSVDELNTSNAILDGSYVNLGFSTNEATKATQEHAQKLSEANSATKEQVNENTKLISETKDLTEGFKDQADGMSDLADAHEKVQKGGKLTSDEMLNLVETYPELNELVRLHGAAVLNDASILSNASTANREERRNNVISAIEETKSNIATMQDQAEAAKISYAVIVSAIKSAMVARGIFSKADKEIYDRIGADAKAQADEIDKQVADLESDLVKLEILLETINSTPTTSGSGGGSGKSARSEAKKKEVNELFEAEYKIYETERKFGELSDAEAIERLEQMKAKTKANADDLEKIEYEQYKLREGLRKEEEKELEKARKEDEKAVQEYGSAVAEAMKRQKRQEIDELKAGVKDQIDVLKDFSYKDIDLSTETHKLKVSLLDEEYRERIKGIDAALDADLAADDERIKKHLEVIALTNSELAKKLEANQKAMDSLDEQEKSEREAIEKKSNEEREAELLKRLEAAETAEDIERAEKDLADFRENLQIKENQKKRSEEKKQLQEDKKDLISEAQNALDKELEEINKISTAQEEAIKRFGEALSTADFEDGRKSIKQLEEDYKKFTETAEKSAALLVISGEEGQKEALKILETFYPDWEDKGRKFVDYLTDGLKEEEYKLLDTSSKLGKDAATAFVEGFQSVDTNVGASSDSYDAFSQASSLISAVQAFDQDLTREGRTSLYGVEDVIRKTAYATGVKQPQQKITSEKPQQNIYINTENNYEGITAPDLPYMVERAERTSLRKIKNSLGGAL